MIDEDGNAIVRAPTSSSETVTPWKKLIGISRNKKTRTGRAGCFFEQWLGRQRVAGLDRLDRRNPGGVVGFGAVHQCVVVGLVLDGVGFGDVGGTAQRLDLLQSQRHWLRLDVGSDFAELTVD